MYAKIAGLSAAAILTAGSAMANTSATATTDLNIRANPGPMGEIVGVIPGNESVDVEQCATELDWCKVNYEGKEGWAFSPYLTAMVDEEPVVVRDNIQTLHVKTVDVNSTERTAAATAGGIGAGILAGSLVAGPVGAVAAAAAAGAVAGGAVGMAAVPEETVTYVEANPVDPIYMQGEVVKGAGIPADVDLIAIPDSDYTYLNVNGAPVIVDQDRKIVDIVRG